MRFFLYTYIGEKNFQKSVEKGIFGAKGSLASERTKFFNLKPGDIVLIRDSITKDLNLLGYGRVIGQPFEVYSDDDILWEDEERKGVLMYRLRVKVDFNPDFEFDIDDISWEDIGKLGFRNQKGELMENKQSLGRLFSGNFIEGSEAKRLADLLKVKNYQGSFEKEEEDFSDQKKPSEGVREDEKPKEKIEPLQQGVKKHEESYSIDDIDEDGCFFERDKLEVILERLNTKKNVILQGPPGTGKTWLSKRMAFALIGKRIEEKVKAVQFHPNLSYEDFVRGWRPVGDGKLALVDGPFLEMIERAKKEPGAKYVIVIEEINRGNPAQVFGEMLTLLESDKRKISEALELSYRRSEDEKVYIPENLFVIGTMNIADRALALVDLALRRRFAFIDLEPALGSRWRYWVHINFDIEMEILKEIEDRILMLNKKISEDSSLGPQFQIGHSYVTPTSKIENGRIWFRQIVETEIGPLLEEYWFDNRETALKTKEELMEGL